MRTNQQTTPTRKLKPKLRRAQKAPSRDRLLRSLRRWFGVESFRAGQRETIEAVLAGRDTLAVLPTGAGKSLTYQFAARMLPGLTVVVSPLIALLRDQMDKLAALGIEGARLDSTRTARQREETFRQLEAGRGRLLLITPEGVSAETFRRRIAGRTVSLFVVDEAHCISQWGHDFRPSYLSLRRVIEQLGRPPILALTATATPRVQQDIIEQLGMRDPVRIVVSPYRSNLIFEVERVEGQTAKLRSLLRRVRRLRRPGIVYCATVREVETVWTVLRRARIPAERYHGQMSKHERDAAQDAFMSARRPRVMVATSAFGMGVDKPDIRYVIHHQVPGSLEAYVQEAGRAGRDGKPARCILQFDPKDLEIQEHFLERQYPSRAQVRQVAEALQAWSQSGRAATLRELALSAHVPQNRTRVVLKLLQDLGFASETESGQYVRRPDGPSLVDVERAAAMFDVQRVLDRHRLDEMVAYATTTECRSRFIRLYFGEEDPPRCGKCDNDRRLERRETEQPPRDLPTERVTIEMPRRIRRVVRERASILPAVSSVSG